MFQLIEVLKTIKDFRKPSGRRHPLWFILLITILGLMTGHLGYRAIGDLGMRSSGTAHPTFWNP